MQAPVWVFADGGGGWWGHKNIIRNLYFSWHSLSGIQDQNKVQDADRWKKAELQ